MTLIRLILRSLRYYAATNMATAAGIAISTAIIVGALIIGDSLRHSLTQVVEYRLGQTTHTLTAGERLFTRNFAGRLTETGAFDAAAAIKTEAILNKQDQNIRVDKVQVWGIDSLFTQVTGAPGIFSFIGENEAVISVNLARQLQADTGDYILTRFRVTGPIPINTPFVSEAGQTVTRRLKIAAVAGMQELGHFNLNASQSAPYNLFVNLEDLNRMMGLEHKANMIFFRAGNQISQSQMTEAIHKAWTLEDGGLHLKESGNALKIRPERVFLDDHVSQTISKLYPKAEHHLTYFVNSLHTKAGETPYSFVSASNRSFLIGNDDFVRNKPITGVHDSIVRTNEDLPKSLYRPLQHNEIVINTWLAEDLKCGVGDSLLMRYYEIGPLRELLEHETIFYVAGIIPLEKYPNDSILMPYLPGLSDAGSCSEWETGVPVELDAIRQKDEDYWTRYKGTPKAYIALERGQQLWQNRFGTLTTVIFPDEADNALNYRVVLTEHLDPFRMELQLTPVREQGLRAASNGVDFAQLFAGLGMFIIISGLLITWLMLSYSLNQRRNQIRLYSSLGYPLRLIRKIMLGETWLVMLGGALTGVLIAIFYSQGVFAGLNTLWHDIVRTDVLIIRYSFFSVLSGLVASLFIGYLVMFSGLKVALAKNLHASQSRNFRSRRLKKRSAGIIPVAAFLFFLLAILLVLFQETGLLQDQLFSWLLAGISFFSSLLLTIYHVLFQSPEKPDLRFSISKLGWRNLRRNPVRSFNVITLLALGSFAIIVTASNRKDLSIRPDDQKSGTGGFSHMATTTIPIPRNLNQPDTRLELGMPEDIRFIQFQSVYDDDASCLNLNMVENPRLIATESGQLSGRFTFTTLHPASGTGDPWEILQHGTERIIPGIADQTVIQWGLGKKVGDTLTYLNAMGEEIKVWLAAGLGNSIFQGNVIISADNMQKHFPSTGGSTLFLLETSGIPETYLQNSVEELSFLLRDYGWNLKTTHAVLSNFNTIENTYLKIFFLMGAFGMLLGTIGLAVMLAKNMLERKQEIALLQALGFKPTPMIFLFASEYASLFLIGLLSGTLAALLATFPSLTSGSQNIPVGYLATVFGIIILNGFFWILVIPSLLMKKISPTQNLRND